MSDARRKVRKLSPSHGEGPDSSDTKPVRESEQLDWGALSNYVREKLTTLLGARFAAAAPMTIEQFPGGHSNLTYLLRFGDQEFVMRRPPLGTVPPRAHDMAREFRILEALHPVFPLAPQPFVLCENANVIGSIFYLMERRHGLVVRSDEPRELTDRPEARRQASKAMMDASSGAVVFELRSVSINIRLLRS